MTTAFVSVIVPGLHTTVQDLGRWGRQASGVSVSGAMDPFSHRLANALVGNNRGAATLEMTMAGPEVEFEDERTVAIAGAVFETELDGRRVAHEAAFRVRRHSRLRVGGRVTGARGYLAVSGGIDVPVVLGSRSTHIGTAIGGHFGRVLHRGDRLPIGALPSSAQPRRTASGNRAGVAMLVAAAPPTLRVLPGPHSDRFAETALVVLQTQSYVVSNQANRMGYRLEGPVLPHTRGADLLSEATAHGALQVPGTGQPVLLMADRQTTGGYPCVATVISADIPVAAQIAPGERVSFKVCTIAEAMAALIARERVLLAQETDQ
jgi:antagonist of KipI